MRESEATDACRRRRRASLVNRYIHRSLDDTRHCYDSDIETHSSHRSSPPDNLHSIQSSPHSYQQQLTMGHILSPIIMCISRATVSAVSCLVVPAFICTDLLISRVLKINDDDDDDYPLLLPFISTQVHNYVTPTRVLHNSKSNNSLSITH